MNLEKYRLLFVDEATEHVGEMATALVQLDEPESRTQGRQAIDTLFRMAHSIKGMAASLDYGAISALAHRLEDWLEPFRQEGDLPRSARPVLFKAVRALGEMVQSVGETGMDPAHREDLVTSLSRPFGPAYSDEDGSSPPVAVASEGVAAPPLPPSVRVRTRLVDQFLVGVSELVQRQSRLEALHQACPFWAGQREFNDELEGMAHVVRELRQRALDIRTTPVRRVFERLPRLASEIAHELGKRVRVELSGEESEADRAVVDGLDDPLLHLLRNALDHGLETPEERERAGKDPVGCVRLSARTARGRLFVRIEEDGRGIDVEAVRRCAIQRGLLLEEIAEDLPPERICELIFEPGISTREEVTELSGRGVGLDAVKRSLEALGGTLSLTSRAGEGTRFEIELPSMSVLQRVLVCMLGGERFALPVDPVQAVLSIDEGSIERTDQETFFVWKDEPLPLIDLAERLARPAPPLTPWGNILVIELRGFRLALRADRVVTDLEVFVREVPSVLGPLELLGGVAILPDGVPVFLLDAGRLVESFR